MYERRHEAEILREQAARCRRLADAVSDAETERRLLELAEELRNERPPRKRASGAAEQN
jgi:hypothetical protein